MWTVRTPVTHVVFFYIKLDEMNRRDFCLQEAPSSCRDALTYIVKHFPYQEQGAQMGVLCKNSICEIGSSAHMISLIVLRNETTFLEESVYFPAVEDKSELSLLP